jgi:hypothetical protein
MYIGVCFPFRKFGGEIPTVLLLSQSIPVEVVGEDFLSLFVLDSFDFFEDFGEEIALGLYVLANLTGEVGSSLSLLVLIRN